MSKNLTTKTVIIVATILLCVYGIIGIPKSGAELKANIQNNIRLGLDLRGGSHLILQVQVQDALKSEADQTIDRLKEEFKKANIEYGGMDRNDPQRIEDADSIQINIKGVPVQRSGDLRGIVSDRFQNWVLTPVSSTDYRMNMRPTELMAIKRDTVERSIRTIENRINALGLTEPVVQQHGRADAEFEILVQLPGVDDPARVKQIMGRRPYSRLSKSKTVRSPRGKPPVPNRRCAAPQHETGAEDAAPRSGRNVVPGYAHAGHHRPRSAQLPSRTGRIRQVGNRLHADPGWRPPFRPLHGIQHRQPTGHCAGRSGAQRADHSGAH